MKDRQNVLPHALKLNWVYELPMGQGRMLFSSAGRLADRFLGGWELEGTGRIQSGSQIDLGNVRLVGMTDADLKDSLGMYFDDANKKTVYAEQTKKAGDDGVSNCPLCAIGHDANKYKIWKLSEMDADHVAAWSKGGATDIKNCQMLCKTHKRAKGNR